MSDINDLLPAYMRWANSYREYVEMMACAFSKETHLLPSECMMFVHSTGPDANGIMTQKIWFEKKAPPE